MRSAGIAIATMKLTTRLIGSGPCYISFLAPELVTKFHKGSLLVRNQRLINTPISTAGERAERNISAGG